MTPREFAIYVVKHLHDAGHQALWAGGCVRDQLLHLPPKDYDVATSATPEQVRSVFGKKRTLAIGASFGVITVLGPKGVTPIEVATFRRDGGYSDGRRPDSVEFTDAREDALRRDFTINGMFYDPLSSLVLDYVGGNDDLKARQVRAIRDPHERIKEDKLRMLRGVRFASTFGFSIEQTTLAAIQMHAAEISVVSGERIGAEMKRMLASPCRAVAIGLLRDTDLLTEIVPDAERLLEEKTWNPMIERMRKLNGDFESAVAVLMDAMGKSDTAELASRWKLSNQEKKSIAWILKNWKSLKRADELSWSQIQPLLLNRLDAEQALAVAECSGEKNGPGVEFCRQRLAWPQDQLNPDPLLDGSDLIRLGIAPGPEFAKILGRLRDAQLDGQILSTPEAESWVQSQTC